VAGVEADDVIATLAEESLSSGMKVRVASPDKDFFQLLCPRLSLPPRARAHALCKATGEPPVPLHRAHAGAAPPLFHLR